MAAQPSSKPAGRQMGLMEAPRVDQVHDDAVAFPENKVKHSNLNPNAPGKWYITAGKDVMDKLREHYRTEPCPSQAQFEAIAKELGAPNWRCVKTYFDQMMVDSSVVNVTS